MLKIKQVRFRQNKKVKRIEYYVIKLFKKNNIIKNLSNGIEDLAKRRNVTIIKGKAKFASANKLILSTSSEEKSIKFKKDYPELYEEENESKYNPNLDYQKLINEPVSPPNPIKEKLAMLQKSRKTV